MSKSNALVLIDQSLQDAERAIHAHPPAIVALYEEGLVAFVEGQDTQTEHPATSAEGITVDEFKLLQRYLLTMAFIAAWYHRHSNNAQRDKASHAAARLVSSIGLDSVGVFRAFLDYERSWRESMRRAGIGRSSGLGCFVVVLVGVGITLMSIVRS
jgi:hypothetical protein